MSRFKTIFCRSDDFGERISMVVPGAKHPLTLTLTQVAGRT
jgi:hypothetical protein